MVVDYQNRYFMGDDNVVVVDESLAVKAQVCC